MARFSHTFSYPKSFVQPVPSLVGGQKSQAQGVLAPGGSSFDLGGQLVYDSVYLMSNNLGGLRMTENTVFSFGKVGWVAAFANQPCEIRLKFGGNDFDTVALIYADMKQVQDYPPMFVPNDATKWTVWRNIFLHDRFWVPELVNMGAGNATVWRIHWGILDAAHGATA